MAKHFTVSPLEVQNEWSMSMFLDCLESMQVEAEVNYRIQQESK